MLLAQTEISSWAEHGIVGLVLFALFGALIYLLRTHREERSEFHKQCEEQRNKADTSHREERKEWHAAQERREQRSELLFKSLEQTIRDSRNS